MKKIVQNTIKIIDLRKNTWKISNGITLENYMSSQLESSDFGEHTLVLTFDQAAKEKVLEMEGAQNVEVLTELTGDELEILDPYGAELVTYGICYETLSNTIHKLAEILNEEYDRNENE